MKVAGVVGTVRHIPGETGKQLRQAMEAVGKRYIQVHKAARLKAPAPPHSSGRSGAAGIHGTAKPGGFLKGIKYEAEGHTLDTLRMKIYTKGMIAQIHEFGRTLNRRMTMPMPIAKDRWGRLTPKAQRIKMLSRMAAKINPAGRKTAKAILGDKTIAIRTKDGRVFAAIVNPGKKGRERLTFWFHYEKQATWRPRLGFYSEWKRWLGQGEARKKFFAALQAGVKRAQQHGKTGA